MSPWGNRHVLMEVRKCHTTQRDMVAIAFSTLSFVSFDLFDGKLNLNNERFVSCEGSKGSTVQRQHQSNEQLKERPMYERNAG
jgi:hypothetical protein